jgi:hypothetical protein
MGLRALESRCSDLPMASEDAAHFAGISSKGVVVASVVYEKERVVLLRGVPVAPRVRVTRVTQLNG